MSNSLSVLSGAQTAPSMFLPQTFAGDGDGGSKVTQIPPSYNDPGDASQFDGSSVQTGAGQPSSGPSISVTLPGDQGASSCLPQDPISQRTSEGLDDATSTVAGSTDGGVALQRKPVVPRSPENQSSDAEGHDQTTGSDFFARSLESITKGALVGTVLGLALVAAAGARNRYTKEAQSVPVNASPSAKADDA